MPSLQKITLRPFIGGLNTEINGTIDTTENTADELNCTIYNDGTRGRRYGLSLERYGEYFNTEMASAYNGYLWKNVNKTPQDIIVYQVDNILHFYKYQQKPYSIYKYANTLDISGAIIDMGNFKSSVTSFTICDGKLVMVNKYMSPIMITFDNGAESFSYKIIHIRYRDFEGLDDGLRIEEMPFNLSNEHHYNLINQGWQDTEINAVKSKRNLYPANNMQWFMGKDSSGAFQTESLLAKYFGNTKAPKGHCILDYFDRDRSAASGIYDMNGAKTQYYGYFNRFPSGNWAWCYETYMSNFTIEIPNSKGIASSFRFQVTASGNYLSDPQQGATVTLYGWNGSSWQFVEIKSTGTFRAKGDWTWPLTNEIEYQKYKLDVHLTVGVSDMHCNATVAMRGKSNIFKYTGPSTRVTDVTSMAGKLFYLAGDTVLFTQTIEEDAKNVGYCYQANDPTSEEISDLVPTDGGHVKFNAMGDGLALASFNRGVIVFGRDKVYGLLSPADKRFSATEYDTVELSSAGLAGNKSVVSVSDAVFYWSPLGIFRIGVNPNTGSTLVAQNIASGTIQQYYNNITQYSKDNARAVFDYATNRIYWYYPLTEGEPWRLNGVLVYDLNYNAFMPYKISDGGAVVAVFTTITAERNRPVYNLFAGDMLIKAGEDNVIAKEISTKYDRFQALQHCIIDDTGNISFGDYNSRDYKDWLTSSYDSFMLSTPLTFDDTYYSKQAPLLQTVMSRTEEDFTTVHNKYIGQSGAYLRMRWGWAFDDRSNRWDLIQNCYKPQKDFLYTDYIPTLLHIRGRGRALQVEIRNDKDKDFRLANINLLVRV